MPPTREDELDARTLDRVVGDFPVGVYRTSPDGRFLYANRALARILGYQDVESLMKRSPADMYVDSEDRRRWREEIEAEGVVRHVEIPIRRRDGTRAWIRHTGRAAEGPDGEVRFYEGQVEDVTDVVRMRAQRDRDRDLLGLLEAVAAASNAAADPEQAYRRALEEVCAVMAWPVGHVYAPSDDDPDLLVPSGIWHVSGPGSFEAFRDATAASPFEVGRGLPGRVFESGEPEWIADLPSAADFHRTELMEHREVGAGFAFPVLVEGRSAAVLEFFSPDFEEPDERVLETMRRVGLSLGQVVERARSQQEVRRLNRELEERVERRTEELRATVRELEAFTYSVSHDLRAPLRALDGFSEAVLEDYGEELDRTGRDYLGRIRRAAQRMGSILDDLLRLSRISRRELEVEEVDLAELAREVAAGIAESRPDREVHFTAPDALSVRADPRLLRIVLENLLGNAWKFTGQKDEPPVELGSEEVDGRRCYFVRDNGAGFDGDYADKLFRPFQRLHRDDEFSGSGIGLATVQRIIRRHGGHVWAEGEPGAGATFYFTLAGGADHESFRPSRETDS